MNKEDSVISIKFYSMQKQIDELQQENKQLKERIDKAIKYIEEEKEEFTEIEMETQEYKYDYVLANLLLEILKGDSNE